MRKSIEVDELDRNILQIVRDTPGMNVTGIGAHIPTIRYLKVRERVYKLAAWRLLRLERKNRDGIFVFVDKALEDIA